jgi:hypothetical protein
MMILSHRGFESVLFRVFPLKAFPICDRPSLGNPAGSRSERNIYMLEPGKNGTVRDGPFRLYR